MTDVIFVQVIFSRLRASPYNFENMNYNITQNYNKKYNMNLRLIEV